MFYLFYRDAIVRDIWMTNDTSSIVDSFILRRPNVFRPSGFWRKDSELSKTSMKIVFESTKLYLTFSLKKLKPKSAGLHNVSIKKLYLFLFGLHKTHKMGKKTIIGPWNMPLSKTSGGQNYIPYLSAVQFINTT